MSAHFYVKNKSLYSCNIDQYKFLRPASIRSIVSWMEIKRSKTMRCQKVRLNFVMHTKSLPSISFKSTNWCFASIPTFYIYFASCFHSFTLLFVSDYLHRSPHNTNSPWVKISIFIQQIIELLLHLHKARIFNTVHHLKRRYMCIVSLHI